MSLLPSRSRVEKKRAISPPIDGNEKQGHLCSSMHAVHLFVYIIYWRRLTNTLALRIL